MGKKLGFYIAAIIVFAVFAIIALTGGDWDTPAHLDALLGLGLVLAVVGLACPPIQ